MGYRLNRLDEPAFMTVSKPLLTEFGINHRLESCAFKFGPANLEAEIWTPECDFFIAHTLGSHKNRSMSTNIKIKPMHVQK